VASGGELSRLALAIRTIEAKSNQLGTLIFDEIDTGVSGKVAANIGSMFKSIAMHHQLIAITHLPQVAASGQYHYFVSKSEKDNKTYTQIHQLSNTERIEQLANMLSGNAISESAMQNAKELLKQA
jgi:DNA repair protein RecN (Recombination protein N)